MSKLKPNMKERAELVRAMETIARNLNDEEIIYSWLLCGVADGDIDEETTDEDLEWYCEDDNLADLMNVFMRCMARARKSGGLYCDGVCAGEKPEGAVV